MENVATYLGQKGYTIKKENMEIKDQIELRTDLMVKPFVPKTSMVKPESFPIYREAKKKFYIPRFYGIDTYGEPDITKLNPGKDIDLKFNGDLRDFQKPIVNAYLKHAKKKGSGLLEIHTGAGKCTKKGTPIMLSNGKIKKVENIKVGDKLMGDDSTPRTVLSLARGREMMYDIIPVKGDKYTVNESHILSLRCGYSNGNKNYIKDKIIDIEVRDFLKLPKTIKNHLLKGYRVPIHFPYKHVDLDPYVLGYWLGDGHSNAPAITTEDEPVVEYFRYYCEDLGLRLHQGKDSETTRHSLHYRMSSNGRKGDNPMLNMLRKYNLINNKHIPHVYKCNSRDIQLELLAGIIDSDGSLSHGGYDIIQKNETLLDDIIYVARSLGFAAYKTKCEKSCMYKGEKKTGTYYRTNIHGEGVEYIPVKVERKKANKRKQIKNVLNTGIEVVKKEVGDYYGFEIDGNRRFVLGDFTVTHNTVMGLWCLAALKKKTLIIVHKEFLLRQWIERIEQFLPKARVGKIQASVIDIEDKDIVIGMLQSLSMKDYDQNIFNEFGFTIIDECFPFRQHIHTDKGAVRIGSLYEKWENKEELPKILSFNRGTKQFEYKKMTYAWRKEKEDLITIKLSKKVINCTPEHKILTTKGYVEANKLNEGDLIISKYDKNHIDNIISPALNEDQLQVVYGSYLGDGHIGITKKNRYRLRFTHGEKQKEYCEWKANMFGIEELTYIEKNGYSQKPAYNFQTKIFDLEDEMPKDTKNVPDWLLDKLDERGIAIWYMDDGSIDKHKLKDGSISNYISIHSNNFDYEIQEKFVKKFNHYGIDCTISKTKGKYYYLRFNKENTLKLLQLISPYIQASMRYKIDVRKENYEWDSKFLDYGLLKVTSKSYFKNKGANRCKKPYVYDIEVEDNHNFVLGTKTGGKQKDFIDGPVVSNCHHISAEVFSRVLFKVVTPYALGLSATMKRKDGLTKVLKMFLGEVVYKKERKGEDNVLVKAVNYYLDDDEFLEISLNYRQQVNYTAMMKKLCELNHRREFILKVLEDLVEKGEEDTQIMVLGHYKTILTYIYEAIKHRGIATVGYYVGGMKEKDLKKSEGKKIIIATYAMAEEGLDIKTLTTLVMATPKSDVTQAVGRILRKKRDESLVVDIVDPHIIFQKQYMKRKRFYKKQNFQLKETDMEGYYKDEWETKLTNKKGTKKSTKKNSPFTNGVCLIKDDD